MKILWLLIFCVLFSACSEVYEQSYKGFEDLSQANLRLKSWFPNIVGPDCFDLREIHTIGDSESYGKFSYSNDFRMDSMLADTAVYRQTSVDSFQLLLRRFKDLKPPNWFLTKERLQDKMFFRGEAKWFVRDKKHKTIYFAYTLK